MFFCVVFVRAQQTNAPPDKGGKIAPYFPTPETIVDKMLKLGELKAGETMFDLGSGDGRIVIDAARKYKAIAIGVELDDSLYKQSMNRIKSLGLSPTTRIIHGDLASAGLFFRGSSNRLSAAGGDRIWSRRFSKNSSRRALASWRTISSSRRGRRSERWISTTTAKAGRTNCTSTAAKP